MNKALLALLLIPSLAFAKPWWLQDSKAKEGDFLQPDEAFRVSARVDGELLRVRWSIADGYYLYRAKFDIAPESPDLTLEKPVWPDSLSKTDEYFGTQEIYRQSVEAVVGFKRSDAGAHPLQIKVTYQGCADAGLCYPPILKVLYPESPAAAMTPVSPSPAPAVAPSGTPPAPFARAYAGPATPFSWLSQRLAILAVIAGVAIFFAAGLALRGKRSATAL